jgi:hypothetical protein
MPEVASIWAPGNIVRNQQAGAKFLLPFEDKPLSDQYGFAGGFATSFTIAQGKEVWFHFPFQTPVALPGAPRIYLAEARLLFETKRGAEIAWVTVHHGGLQRIELTPRLTILSGRHVDGLDEVNTFPLRPRLKLTYGVQMCVLARAPEAAGDVSFYGAGLSLWDEA